MTDAENQIKGGMPPQTGLTCPVCDTPLNPGETGQIVHTICPSCDTGMQASVFPAMYQTRAKNQKATPLIMGDEASCFYHKGKKAVVPCSSCGRFLCALCDIDINGRHLCPVCIKAKKQDLGNLENSRVLYDRIALYLSIVPLTVFLWFMTVISAPATIFVVIRYWKAPNSIVSGSRTRYICASLFALIQIGCIIAVIYALSIKKS